MARPVILNLYKPKDLTSYDVIRKWKPKLKAMGKIGHFGTLDPFAEGVLMLGIAGAQRLNEYIHECLPKTYLAKGQLGIETATGDLTVDISQNDTGPYLKEVISLFDASFIENTLRKKFLGKYMQAPHQYSAAKYEGKALHQWAREGVEIKKEAVAREVYELEVVKYDFPHLWIRYKVSSGTYIRTLFSDCAKELGTLGVLEGLVREEVGGCRIDNAITQENWDIAEIPFLAIDEVLDFASIILAAKEARLFINGVRLKQDRAESIRPGTIDFGYYWVRDQEGQILGLAEIKDDLIVSKLNFPRD